METQSTKFVDILESEHEWRKMCMKVVSVKRMIPEGGLNPNLNLPYANMKQKLNEHKKFYESTGCKVPISIRRKYAKEDFLAENEYWQDPSHKPEEIVGFLYFFYNDRMDVEIFNEKLFNIFKDPRIEIVSMRDTDDDLDKSKIYVKKVIKLLMSENTES